MESGLGRYKGSGGGDKLIVYLYLFFMGWDGSSFGRTQIQGTMILNRGNELLADC